ncbi:MAG TPA: flagellar hook-associated protein FlgL [candidate division Zixibacteria bacterium]|nr:flagellar hook-associated protein FlgL [candidate division Zixibacteria bacterium]
MRVTNNMMADRVTTNAQLALQRFLDLQTQASSGRRINAPSDDPLGILRDLGYRTELAKTDQYRKNISQGQSWNQTYDTVLADLKDMLSSAKEIAISMSNGTYDATAREASANEVKSLFDQMMQLANSEQENKYIFSGFKTDTEALRASANGVRYNGDSGQINFQIDTSTNMAINMTGSSVFLKQLSILGEHADLNVGVTGNSLLADLHNGNGISQTPGTITITDQNLGISSTIDLSGATTLNDAITTINNQLAADGITNLTVALGEEGNNLLLETTNNGLISAATSVDQLNSGAGIDLTDGRIRVTDGAAIDFNVDLSGSATVGDVISKFNAQMTAAGVNNVTMQINPAGTGLQIVDANGTPLDLQISDVGTMSSLASDLGIAGNVGAQLDGRALDPQVSFKIDETGAGTTAADLGIKGEITSDKSGEDLNPVLLATSNIADLNNGNGLNLSEVVIWQGDATRTLDLGSPSIVTVQDLLDTINNSGLDITASINADGTGIQIVNNDQTRSLTIEDNGGTTTAKDMGIFGSSDMMGSMLVLVNALNNDDQEGAGMLLQNLDDGIQNLLNWRASNGAKGIRLQGTDSRLTDRQLTFTQRLTEVEDADMTQVITQLSTYENNYQAALLAASKIIQPSLLNFLQ